MATIPFDKSQDEELFQAVMALPSKYSIVIHLYYYEDYLKQYGDVYVSEALKRVGKKISYNLHVGVSVENNLLKFDISSHEIPKKELQDVLNQYRRKKKFYRLKNGELLYLDSPDLEELSEFMDAYHVDVKDIDNGEFSMINRECSQLMKKMILNM